MPHQPWKQFGTTSLLAIITISAPRRAKQRENIPRLSCGRLLYQKVSYQPGLTMTEGIGGSPLPVCLRRCVGDGRDNRSASEPADMGENVRPFRLKTQPYRQEKRRGLSVVPGFNAVLIER
jgi:hypothetical protein